MSCSTGSTIARASSGSRSRINSVEPLMSANSAVTVLRSPSIVDEASGCSGVTRISEAVNPAGEPVVAGAAIPASAAPQSSQKADDGAFSAPHFEQRLNRGLPHAAQNFLLVVLSVPHLVQRIALPGKPSDSPFLYHPAPVSGSGPGKGDRATSHRLKEQQGPCLGGGTRMRKKSGAREASAGLLHRS